MVFKPQMFVNIYTSVFSYVPELYLHLLNR